MTDYTARYQQAAEHLARHDPHLAPVIAKVGRCTIEPHTNYYQALVMSIIGQQLSVKAAATIKQRFTALFEGTIPTPEQIVATDVEQLRSVGLSGQKAKYVRDLAEHALDGRIRFDDIESLSNDEIIARLTDVKGIGEWTVHMFLMFAMGRTDVLAHGDLGVRNGIRRLYELEHTPSPDDIRDLAATYDWHPYESVACWYMWQFLDNEPK
ncbi:MAG TPA: DNA-3-methyladenine glycosylase [Candidatus Saccharimonadales bacterium]|nr:DNA-3-methyladenine glycosylase [Candidatus Saccharimonadales bacterium]